MKKPKTQKPKNPKNPKSNAGNPKTQDDPKLIQIKAQKGSSPGCILFFARAGHRPHSLACAARPGGIILTPSAVIYIYIYIYIYMYVCIICIYMYIYIYIHKYVNC